MTGPVKAVLFDLDGVIINSPLDLGAIKRELFGDENVYIIEGLDSLPDNEKSEKEKILLERELQAASNSTVNPDAEKIFSWLEVNGLSRGIVTRNSRDVVNVICKLHGLEFDVVVAREDAPPKPAKESVLTACKELGVTPEETIMVGDYAFDIEAGHLAGCRTAFLETEDYAHLESGEDFWIKSLIELIGIVGKINSGSGVISK
jgi:HAD superfamily hydrolase (TIGR01549 family)